MVGRLAGLLHLDSPHHSFFGGKPTNTDQEYTSLEDADGTYDAIMDNSQSRKLLQMLHGGMADMMNWHYGSSRSDSYGVGGYSSSNAGYDGLASNFDSISSSSSSSRSNSNGGLFVEDDIISDGMLMEHHLQQQQQRHQQLRHLMAATCDIRYIDPSSFNQMHILLFTLTTVHVLYTGACMWLASVALRYAVRHLKSDEERVAYYKETLSKARKRLADPSLRSWIRAFFNSFYKVC